jgi:hypothetical protein
MIEGGKYKILYSYQGRGVMKIKTLLIIMAFILSPLFLPIDSYSKGGGKGGGGGHGGGHHGGGHQGGPHGGHYGYPQTGSHHIGGSYFSRNYFPSSYPRCYSCHRGIKGLGFGRCKYLGINSQEAAEHNLMIEEYSKSEKYGPDWRLREIGP